MTWLPRWTCVAALLLGVWGAAAVVLELADASSRATHMFGPARWIVAAALAGAGLLSLAAGIRELTARGPAPGPGVLRDVFTLAVLCFAAQLIPSQGYKPALLATTLCLASGALAVSRVFQRWLAPLRQWRPIALFERILFQTCLVVVLLEFGLRVIATVVPSPLFATDQETIEWIERHRYEPGAMRFGFPINSGGHYDQEFEPAEFTVVSIGDSFSIGVVPHRYHFTTVCERELGDAAVHNLGHTAIGPGAYLWLLEREGLALDPDAIVINVFAGNDVYESGRWSDDGELLKSLCDRRNVLSWLVPLRLKRLWLDGGDDREGRGAGHLLGENRFKQREEDPEALRRAFPWLDDPTQEHSPFSPTQFITVEAERQERIHQADRHGWFELFFSAMAQIRDAAGDIPLVVMLIPDEFQVEDDLWEEITAYNGNRSFDRDEPQKRITAWLEQEGIPYLDLLPMMRAVEPMADGKRHLYHLRDTHFNARGNRIAGEALAAFLRERRQ